MQYCAKVMQTIIDEYRQYLIRFYLKRYIKRYIVRAIVLFLGEISFPVSDISFLLCDISFQPYDILVLLCDISFLLKEISFQFINMALWNTRTLPKDNLPQWRILFVTKSAFLRWRVASYMLLMLAENTIELTCLDSMKKIHSIMREILLQIS